MENLQLYSLLFIPDKQLCSLNKLTFNKEKGALNGFEIEYQPRNCDPTKGP